MQDHANQPPAKGKAACAFGRLKEYFTAHRKMLLRIFYGAMIIAVVIVAFHELQSLSYQHLQEIFHSQSPSVVIGMFALGLLAFLATGIYDLFTRRHFSIDIPAHKALMIGCIAQAFNNFAGLGGLTGGTLRTKHYTARGINTKQALNLTMIIWLANLLGLFVLTILTVPFAHEYLNREIIVAIIGSGYIGFFFFGQHFRIGKINFRNSFLAKPNFAQKSQLLFASVIDWLAAAFFFWTCLHVFGTNLDLPFVLFGYSFATIVGLISMLPAGIGSFDVTVIAMFTAAGAEPSRILLGILLFRVSYYLVPWLLALLLSANEYLMNRNSLSGIYRRRNIFHTLLWIGMFFCGAMLVLSAITPDVIARLLRLHQLIPLSIQRTSALTTLNIGIALLVLSIGIRHRVRRIYWATLCALIFGSFSVMLSGLNYEEAMILAVFAVLLVLARESFTAEPLQPTRRRLIISGILVLCIPFVVILLQEFFYHQNTIYYHLIGTSKPSNIIFVNIAVTLLIVFALIFTKSKKLVFTPPTAEDVNRFADFLLRHKGSSYSYLFALGDKQVFYNNNETVAFLYRAHKGSMLVLGDPIGADADFADAIGELIDYAIMHDMKIAFYQVSATYLEMLVEYGMRFVKIGEDASISLTTYSNVGNCGKVFRRMRNRMTQNNTEFEILYPPFDDQTMSQLREVSDSWLGKREEMGFSLGFFDPEYLSAGPIGVIKSDRGFEGFVNIVFIDSARVSFDLMRFRPDAPGGTMDGIMISLIEWAKALGFQELNIGMAPLSNVGRRAYSHGAEKVVKYVHDFGNQIYNFRGLRAYKEKFKPTWKSRYLVYSSARSLPVVLFGLLEIINRPKNDYDYFACEVRKSFGQRVREDVLPNLNRTPIITTDSPFAGLTQKQKQRLQQKPQQKIEK
ncbi:bifunctional lysylphosphatidylglycerol flippase/synthetase MprF [Arcanobacterium hippocoleae]